VEVTVVATPEMASARPSPTTPPLTSIPVDEAISPCPHAGTHAVQVGSFSQKSNAQRLVQELASDYEVDVLEAKSRGKTVHRVTVGRGLDEAEAQRLLAALRQGRIDGLVIRLPSASCDGG
jgi:cell division septation protein DedD